MNRLFRDWLQLFRAQTAPATVFSLIIPYVYAGGRNPLIIIMLFIIGHVLHYASFGHNSVTDYLLGFDKNDPNKKHHPLPAGRIDVVRALWAINILLFISTLSLATLSVYRGRDWSLLALLGYMVWGYAYNFGLDHLSTKSWLPISLAFGFLPMYGALLGSNNPKVAVLFFIWGFITVFYQIAFEGNLKDLWNPTDAAPNILRDVCSIEDDRVFCIPRSKTDLFMIPRIISYLLILAIAGLNIVTLITVGVGIYISMLLHAYMTGTHFARTRKEVLEYMGLQEVIVFYALLIPLLTISWQVALPLIIYGVAYFTLLNRVLWKSKFGPRV